MSGARNGDARGGIVLGWLFKIIVMLAILALVSFETGAVIVAKVTADRVAIDAAAEAGHELDTTRSSTKAEEVARQTAAKDGATVIAFRIMPSGKLVQVTVRKVASTFLIQHIGPLKRFRTADSTHTGQVQ
ncbi:MAG: hypothetical protein ACXVQ6_10930 [Actinomycetota bacterium]